MAKRSLKQRQRRIVFDFRRLAIVAFNDEA